MLFKNKSYRIIEQYCNKHYSKSAVTTLLQQLQNAGERGGSVVECRTPEREVRGSRPTAAVLCP